MYFHIQLTPECNSRCRYCYEKSMNDFGNKLCEKFKFDFSIPLRINYKIEDLKKFLNKNKSKQGKHTLIFYGGEPLMDIEKITEIMDKIDARFMMQTNGLLLDKVPAQYIKKFTTILVSIDGTRELTDFNRGKGTYDKVIDNIKIIRDKGFSGELIARMVMDEHSNLLEQVRHLLSIGFGSIHWQIDAGFYANDFQTRNFKEYSEKYNKQVSELADFWVEEMKKGSVIKIYPFLGIFDGLYNDKKFNLRCGSGYANYTIATDGKIAVCPIMPDVKNFHVGDIHKSEPEKLRQIHVDECRECEIYNLCGGRCLYQQKAQLWPEEGRNLICKTVFHLVNAIKARISEISVLIDKKIIKKEQFEYEQFTGPEIIP